MSLCQQQFLRLLQPEIFEEFRSRYEGINPDRPLETVEISYALSEPLFQVFVKDYLEFYAFADGFLLQMGRLLQGYFLLSGAQVRCTRPVHRDKVIHDQS